MHSKINKITIIISSKDHPVYSVISNWAIGRSASLQIEIVESYRKATGGDICFLLSCNEIVPRSVLSQYNHSLVIHASDLPRGRGWSPHIWHILSGGTNIVVSLLEAADKVDTGDIWKKNKYQIPKYYIYEDIIDVLNTAHIELMNFAIKHHNKVKPRKQSNKIFPTWYRKRSPRDSEISPYSSIAEQFDLLRVCDKTRFPSYFYLHGKKYKIFIERSDD